MCIVESLSCSCLIQRRTERSRGLNGDEVSPFSSRTEAQLALLLNGSEIRNDTQALHTLSVLKIFTRDIPSAGKPDAAFLHLVFVGIH